MIIIENITVSRYQNINKDISNTQHSLFESEGGVIFVRFTRGIVHAVVFTIDYCHVFVFITNTSFIGEWYFLYLYIGMNTCIAWFFRLRWRAFTEITISYCLYLYAVLHFCDGMWYFWVEVNMFRFFIVCLCLVSLEIQLSWKVWNFITT
jgi:hypothetical protein